ncbi:MAG: hypothetical protein A2497_08170 [Candidatus Firestonebacteria bacterium RifOxyC12_full_39_7]|nr:MAG: hypothetical protein A2497_08170 [Candidatus Firestonebacteria bacterium RifOxyC12_full_39_7]
MKNRLNKEGRKSVTKCNQLELPAYESKLWNYPKDMDRLSTSLKYRQKGGYKLYIPLSVETPEGGTSPVYSDRWRK